MTTVYLLLWISGGILLQLAVYLCIVYWRHRQTYESLRSVAREPEMPVHADGPEAAAEPKTAPWAGYRSFRVERKVQEDALAQVCSFYLAPEDGKPLAPFLPGQFLTFALEATDASGKTQSIVRCYSLSDAPQSGSYRITVKRVRAPVGSGFSDGQSSSHFHDRIAVGSALQVRAPAGHFHIDRSDAPVVLIGGGIGITPLLSMLNWCLAAQPGREVWLFHGVRNGAELLMSAQLRELAARHPHFHLHLCLSDPQADDISGHRAGSVHCHHSRADVALLRRVLPLKPYHFYICGPTAMLQSLVPALDDWGVPDERIHFEAFGPASIARKDKAAVTQATSRSREREGTVLVTFAKSGKQATWEPALGSLLELAETHGIAVSSGCRAGACGSCQTGLRAGEVAYATAPDFDPAPGTCLLCVGTPKTAVTLEA